MRLVVPKFSTFKKKCGEQSGMVGKRDHKCSVMVVPMRVFEEVWVCPLGIPSEVRISLATD